MKLFISDNDAKYLDDKKKLILNDLTDYYSEKDEETVIEIKSIQSLSTISRLFERAGKKPTFMFLDESETRRVLIISDLF